MTQPFLFVSVPCYGGSLSLHTASALLALKDACAQRGVGLHIDLNSGDALVTRGRSRTAAEFLAHAEATHLLTVDSDIGFSPSTVFRLLDSGKDLIAGICPLKRIDWDRVRAAAKADVADILGASVGYVLRFIPNPENRVEVNDGFAQVAYVGTGFMMVSRAAMQKISDAHPNLRAKMGDMTGSGAAEAVMVYETMIEPETGQYLSEDYALCRRWRDLGGEVWADLEARLTHVGHMAYTGSAMQALRAG